MKYISYLVTCFLTLAFLASSYAKARIDDFRPYDGVKYCFFFIGDGMAAPQIHLTEAYLASLDEDDAVSGGKKFSKLTMSKFPINGLQTSHALNSLITGSAAAGTALATGKKTNTQIIAMSPDATEPYTSIAEKAKNKGMKVGIVTTVPIDNATPAVFYSHTGHRYNSEDIISQLLDSGFDYFVGGGYQVYKWTREEYKDLTYEEIYELIKNTAISHGFTYADTQAEFEAASSPLLAITPERDRYHGMPFSIDRKALGGPGEKYEGCLSLAEYTQKGIDLMKGHTEGFFMMVEGGKVDWACHMHDGRAAIEEVIDFDKAIQVAVDFANEHPRDTLIVVTGDHECGGMTLGYAATAYSTAYEILAKQKVSNEHFNSEILTAYKTAHDPAPDNIDNDMWQLVLDYFGIDGSSLTESLDDDLTEFETALLEEAFDKTMTGINTNLDEENRILYGDYEPFTVTLTSIINRKAGMSWTTYAHTAVPVPVMAYGKDAWRFNGYYDNTDVAKKIAAAMGIELE